MCSPAANLGKEPRQMFVIQLSEAVEEWRSVAWLACDKVQLSQV